MSRDASITLTWADGDYTFRLGWGELEMLQEARNAGPYVILGRLQSDAWMVGDIADTLRIGLIGGGMKPTDALAKVRQYVEKRPPVESLAYAQVVLTAGCIGAPEENLGEIDAPSPGGSLSTTSQTED